MKFSIRCDGAVLVRSRDEIRRVRSIINFSPRSCPERFTGFVFVKFPRKNEEDSVTSVETVHRRWRIRSRGDRPFPLKRVATRRRGITRSAGKRARCLTARAFFKRGDLSRKGARGNKASLYIPSYIFVYPTGTIQTRVIVSRESL